MSLESKNADYKEYRILFNVVAASLLSAAIIKDDKEFLSHSAFYAGMSLVMSVKININDKKIIRLKYSGAR